MTPYGLTEYEKERNRACLAHRAAWTVDVRRANYSAFSGYQRTPSAYSQLRCGACGRVWRTKAAYVDTLPDTTKDGSQCPPP